ncbi:MAG: UrcA family protein [Pseudomonadales bacterium]|nr:UrcA family protein [Pseudomonadales bacterium]
MKNATLQNSTLAAVLATLTLSIATTTAHADSQINIPPTVTVSYADLDLSKPAGAETLYGRIAGAARSVCPYNLRDLREVAAGRACMRTAIAKAVADVDKPMLTANYQRKFAAKLPSDVTARNE